MSDEMNVIPPVYSDNNEQQSAEQNLGSPAKKKPIGLAVASMIIGILMLLGGICIYGLALFVSVALMFIPIILSLLAIVFGIVSLVKNHRGKGMAITGIIVSFITIISCICMMFSISYIGAQIKKDRGYSPSELTEAIANGEAYQEELQKAQEEIENAKEGNYVQTIDTEQ